MKFAIFQEYSTCSLCEKLIITVNVHLFVLLSMKINDYISHLQLLIGSEISIAEALALKLCITPFPRKALVFHVRIMQMCVVSNYGACGAQAPWHCIQAPL